MSTANEGDDCNKLNRMGLQDRMNRMCEQKYGGKDPISFAKISPTTAKQPHISWKRAKQNSTKYTWDGMKKNHLYVKLALTLNPLPQPTAIFSKI